MTHAPGQVDIPPRPATAQPAAFVEARPVAGSGELPRVLVIVPAYNEAGAIASVVREVRALGPSFEALVIDDGSRDATAARARAAGARVASLPANLGIGGAVQTGIRAAFRARADFCVQVDGDGQHDPLSLQVLLDTQRRTGADIVIGSRYLGAGPGDRSTALRRFGSRVLCSVLPACFGGTRVTDPTSGLRLMGPRAIALFAADYPHDYPEPISLAAALRNGLRIAEIPVAMRAREHGRSSISGLKTAFYMLRVSAYIILARVADRRPATEDLP